MNHESTLLNIQNMYGCHLSHEKWMLKAAVFMSNLHGTIQQRGKKSIFLIPLSKSWHRQFIHKHAVRCTSITWWHREKKRNHFNSKHSPLLPLLSFFAYLSRLLLTSIIKKWIECVLLVAYKMRWKKEEEISIKVFTFHRDKFSPNVICMYEGWCWGTLLLVIPLWYDFERIYWVI